MADERPKDRAAPKGRRANKETDPPLPTEAAENSIERARTRGRGKATEAKNPPTRGEPTTAPANDRAAGAAPMKDETSRAVPDEIRERFIGVGSNYYFPDGSAAFRDHGVKLTTRSENTEVIRSLIAIAQAREWRDITVTGSERFRKEAWFAGRLVGLDVKGYTPTAFEEERVVRAIARRDAGAAGREGDEAAADRDDGRRSSRASPATGGQREPNLEPITGRLVDHGRANYQHNPKEPVSYYVRVETTRGDREIWGVDLERAFRESLSRPTLGDEVTLRAQGRDPVTVSAPQRDAEGRIVGKEEIATHRNRWIVERNDFLAERVAAAAAFRDARVKPAEAIKAHPELQGSYLQLQAAKLGAERDIRDPDDRTRFVARARAAIAAAIERGEPLEPVRLKERPPKNIEPEKTREPDRTPTR
jgi:hypothetical protein